MATAAKLAREKDSTVSERRRPHCAEAVGSRCYTDDSSLENALDFCLQGVERQCGRVFERDEEAKRADAWAWEGGRHGWASHFFSIRLVRASLLASYPPKKMKPPSEIHITLGTTPLYRAPNPSSREITLSASRTPVYFP
eukprot:Plantae.Rhodophyta-Purpureofilum_apyrenoidigerum.ctg59981.p1 GENE.Plantae.Rhodophyta-Purpureofilum_apyrenoidigerum.ctg59981~~Plantae.Rhodophyta-Purpureofilum_apyrenoidigerum.ctg59981.p1  ORF type:complete len:140 (+),score=10.72 Plantae.Rhodophyta-Purpureofilum_apyrenoidigerum.ctg59981:82-501(+)